MSQYSLGAFLAIAAILVCGIPPALALECIDGFPYRLDFGFYWASALPTGEIYWSKSCIGNLSSAFDPARPSVVYFHGLQPGAVAARRRFAIDDREIDAAVSANLRLGLNFGVYLWTAQADEPTTNFIRAESKLLSTDFVGGTSYVYLDSQGKTQTSDGPRVTVTETAYLHYLAHWTIDSPRIHLVGHSLGGQLVSYLARSIVTRGETKIDRVTLLDPVYSDSAKPYLTRDLCGRDIPTVLGCILGILREAGVAVDFYAASRINQCIFSSEDNSLIANNTAAVSLLFTSHGSLKEGKCWGKDVLDHPTVNRLKRLEDQIIYQHSAVVSWYIRSSLAATQPRICIVLSDGKCQRSRTSAISGAMSDSDVLEWASKPGCLRQYLDSGTDDEDPSNDMFYVKDCARFNT